MFFVVSIRNKCHSITMSGFELFPQDSAIKPTSPLSDDISQAKIIISYCLFVERSLEFELDFCAVLIFILQRKVLKLVYVYARMHRFNAGDDNDSFDDILARIEEPKIASSASQIPSQPKKTRISVDFDDDDDILANISMPTTSDAANIAVTSSVVPSISTTAAKSNSILVNPKQRGNPILKSIINIPWEFDEAIIPDYIVGATGCVLYLSLRYHQLNPDYIHNRLKLLGKRFELRVLLVQIDTKVRYIIKWRIFFEFEFHFELDFFSGSNECIEKSHANVFIG